MNTKIINLKGLRKGLHTDSYSQLGFDINEKFIIQEYILNFAVRLVYQNKKTGFYKQFLSGTVQFTFTSMKKLNLQMLRKFPCITRQSHISRDNPIYHETIPYITRQCHILRDNPIYHETIPYITRQSHISRHNPIYHEKFPYITKQS